MPTLNQYTKKSSKSGYYIHANAGGTTPVTLQVTALARRLFDLLEYHPGDTLPSKLVWSMYDVGLLYTRKSLHDTIDRTSTGNAPSLVKEFDLESALTEEEQDDIINQLEAYNGPQTEEVDHLIEELRNGDLGPSEQMPSSDTAENEAAASMLSEWINDTSNHEYFSENLYGYHEFSVASIQTFVDHPYLASPPVWVTETADIKYELSRNKYDASIYISDCRFRDTDFSYQVIIEHPAGKETGFVTKNGYLTDYTNDAGRRGSRIRFRGMLDWIIPASPVSVSGTTEIPDPKVISKLDQDELNTILESHDIDKTDLQIVKVDRISNSENPIVQFTDNHVVLDRGEPGGQYIIERTGPQRGRVLTEIDLEEQE